MRLQVEIHNIYQKSVAPPKATSAMDGRGPNLDSSRYLNWADLFEDKIYRNSLSLFKLYNAKDY